MQKSDKKNLFLRGEIRYNRGQRKKFCAFHPKELNEKKAENMEKSEKEGAGMAEKKILIVEDDRGLNQGITLALHAPEYRFYSAYNLKEARRIWKEERVSLIILDINLPDGSGYTFLEEIRRESEVPVIMLTANDLEIDQVTGFSLGADDYITKPSV